MCGQFVGARYSVSTTRLTGLRIAGPVSRDLSPAAMPRTDGWILHSGKPLCIASVVTANAIAIVHTTPLGTAFGVLRYTNAWNLCRFHSGKGE